jgi:predicted RNA binding protein YcfA (HicA-like mRNA interferase family)
VKQVSGKELARLVRQKGWGLARVRGSHQVFVMPGRRERIVIPMHANRPSKMGLLRALMKIADLSEDDLSGHRTGRCTEWRPHDAGCQIRHHGGAAIGELTVA